MEALRFLALATVGIALLAGTLLWYQQVDRLEREAVRVLEGPELILEAGATLRWTLDLDASTSDQAWMDPQRQPFLYIPLPTEGLDAPLPTEGSLPTTGDAGDAGHGGEGSAADSSAGPPPRVRATARYTPTQDHAGAPAFVQPAGAPGPSRVGELEGGALQFGPLWLSYLQPLEVDLEVLDPGALAGRTVRPRLAGSVHPDYAFARTLDRTLFNVFVTLGVLGLLALVLVERRLAADRAPA